MAQRGTSWLAAATLAAAACSPAVAGLVGDTVGCSITPTPLWVCTTPTAVVGAGVEFELELPQAPGSFGFGVDIGNASIRIASNEDNIFGLGANELLVLSGLDAGAPIIGITNLTVSGVSVLSANSITWTADSVTIDLNHGAQWDVGSFVSFDLITANVPEPGSLALGGLALAALGWTRRRRAA
ncbi:MAG: PEP-CTERM sorting domain-containing protein [Burkholderiales bacterium]|nr:PEP-CTERM sorting domain-containing protein [Burkholderiales bacterium]